MPSPTTEQRIAIIADYNADKIKAIRELMEEEALAFNDWRLLSPYRVAPLSGGWYNEIEFRKQSGLEQNINDKKLYELYQQSKQTLNNNL